MGSSDFSSIFFESILKSAYACWIPWIPGAPNKETPIMLQFSIFNFTVSPVKLCFNNFYDALTNGDLADRSFILRRAEMIIFHREIRC